MEPKAKLVAAGWASGLSCRAEAASHKPFSYKPALEAGSASWTGPQSTPHPRAFRHKRAGVSEPPAGPPD